MFYLLDLGDQRLQPHARRLALGEHVVLDRPLPAEDRLGPRETAAAVSETAARLRNMIVCTDVHPEDRARGDKCFLEGDPTQPT